VRYISTAKGDFCSALSVVKGLFALQPNIKWVNTYIVCNVIPEIRRLHMNEKDVILTVEGLKKLEDELAQLKSVKRREVAERIKQAIEFGDISENSEYEDAKNEQAFIEGRILTLEKMLRNAKIIDDENLDTKLVSIGSTVLLKDLECGEEVK
jgi:hypothetical protein